MSAGRDRSPIRVAIVLTLVVGGAFGYGMLRRRGDAAVADAAPGKVRVEVVKPKPVQNGAAFDLPGVIKPLEEAAIYPRATGYVRAWYADIGDKVTAGQLLAEIDVPELQAQLAQARAQLAQARAALRQMAAQRKYSQVNASRYDKLAVDDLVAKEKAEQIDAQAATDEANVAAAQANVEAQAANVRRLTESVGFAKVTAPFAGTITRRTIERGMLVSDARAADMFELVASDPVRVIVEVPQSVAASVEVGTEATLTIRELGDKKFTGKITRTSGALDASLHTLTTEIRLPNPDGKLLPGMYVRASLALATPHKVVELPATALYTDAAGTRVAKVDAQKQIKFVKIAIERDTGATIQIASGITEADKVVKVAVPSLADGDAVEVVVSAPSPGAGSGTAGSADPKASHAGSGATAARSPTP